MEEVKVISIVLPSKMKEAFDKKAKKDNLSKTFIIRELVKEYIDTGRKIGWK